MGDVGGIFALLHAPLTSAGWLKVQTGSRALPKTQAKPSSAAVLCCRGSNLPLGPAADQIPSSLRLGEGASSLPPSLPASDKGRLSSSRVDFDLFL